MVSGGGGPGRAPLRGWRAPRRGVRQRDRLLVAVGEAAEGGGAGGELPLADDGGVLGTEGVGLAHLGLEGALAGGDDGGDAGAAEVGGEAEGGGAGLAHLEGDEHARARGAVDGRLLTLEVEDDALDPGGPTDAGRGPAAELLDQTVVAAAAADGALGALLPGLGL